MSRIRHRHHWIQIAAVLTALSLGIGCSGGGNDAPPDTSPPTVQIIRPSTGALFYTASNPQTILGTAADGNGVAGVSWSTDQGFSGSAAGTGSWSAGIPLVIGANTVTIRAVDDAGNASTDTITFEYTTTVRTLSGTVTAPTYAQVDSDTNDPNAAYTGNDSFATAQSIDNPTLLGGYANLPNTGASGRSAISGDTNDYFSVSLSDGNTVTLYTGESTSGRLDLYLYNDSQTLVASAIGNQATKTITATATGPHFIRVNAVSQASNYTLAVGQPTATGSPAGNPPLNTAHPFLPYEAIVTFAPQSDTTPAALAARVGMTAISGTPDRYIRMKWQPGEQRQNARAALTAARSGMDPAQDDETRARLETLLWIATLRDRPDVASASPNYWVQAFAAPNDSLYGRQWHYPAINLPSAWDATTGSASVIVAVIDTGVLLSHPDMAGQLTAGYDFISLTSVSVDGDGIDPNPDDPGDQSSGGSSSFHGTHVAGTVAAASNNGSGVAGVSWGTKIMPLRVLGKGGGLTSDIIEAIDFAAGLSNASGTVPLQRADIINMSLGGPGFSQGLQDAVTRARAAGVIVIAAAGNDNTSLPSYPGALSNVVSVSAVDLNQDKAYYSNFGSTIDVAAPGGDVRVDLNGDSSPDGVLSTAGNDSGGTIQFVYRWYQGTSMAAPHVAGVAALMKAVNPGMTPSDFDAFLTAGTIVQDLGANGRDDIYGHGLIDAFLAVQAAQGGTATALAVTPTSLNFPPTANPTSSGTLTASQLGTGTLTVDSVTDDADWMTVAEDTVDANKLGTYTVTVDRTHAALTADGNYAAKVTLVSSENTVIVPVNVQVNSSGQPTDAGYHYVLLLTEDSLDTIREIQVSASNGDYAYTIPSVPEGTYRIVAGSDYDNDFRIGDAGESYGIYSSLENPTELVVDGDKSSLDFLTEMTFSVTTTTQTGTPLHSWPVSRLSSGDRHRGIQ